MRSSSYLGHSHFKSGKKDDKNFKAVAQNLQQTNLDSARVIFNDLRKNLDKFVTNHSDKINKDPHFREQFHKICTFMGVDPLMNISNGNWSKLKLGEINTKLSIRILTLCLSSRKINGGVLDMEEVIEKLSKRDHVLVQSKNINQQDDNKNFQSPFEYQSLQDSNITKSDILRAIQHLDELGKNSIQVIKQGDNTLIVSIPSTLRPDQMTCLEVAQKLGYIDYSMFNGAQLESLTSTDTVIWSKERFLESVECFIRDKVVWIDNNPEAQFEKYWFPSIYLRIYHQSQ